MKKALTILATSLLICGCANAINPMGKDTYMVQHRGPAWSTVSSLKTKCLKDANKFCRKKGLAMVPVSTSGRNGGFGIMGSCELVFLAVPPDDPRNAPMEMIKISEKEFEFRPMETKDKP